MKRLIGIALLLVAIPVFAQTVTINAPATSGTCVKKTVQKKALDPVTGQIAIPLKIVNVDVMSCPLIATVTWSGVSLAGNLQGITVKCVKCVNGFDQGLGAGGYVKTADGSVQVYVSLPGSGPYQIYGDVWGNGDIKSAPVAVTAP